MNKAFKHIIQFAIQFAAVALSLSWPLSSYADDLSLINQKDFHHFDVVDAGKIYRGGRPTHEGLQELKAFGIRTVIDLQGGDAVEKGNPIGFVLPLVTPSERVHRNLEEEADAKALGLTFDWLPMAAVVVFDQSITPKEELYVDQALSLMTDSRYYPIYLHCTLGADRTGLIVALYRVSTGWSIEQAHDEWAASGHSGIKGKLLNEFDKYFYDKARRIQEQKSTF